MVTRIVKSLGRLCCFLGGHPLQVQFQQQLCQRVHRATKVAQLSDRVTLASGAKEALEVSYLIAEFLVMLRSRLHVLKTVEQARGLVKVGGVA
jgi:hypothetical protein